MTQLIEAQVQVARKGWQVIVAAHYPVLMVMVDHVLDVSKRKWYTSRYYLKKLLGGTRLPDMVR